jgi:hypothetical protein
LEKPVFYMSFHELRSPPRMKKSTLFSREQTEGEQGVEVTAATQHRPTGRNEKKFTMRKPGLNREWARIDTNEEGRPHASAVAIRAMAHKKDATIAKDGREGRGERHQLMRVVARIHAIGWVVKFSLSPLHGEHLSGSFTHPTRDWIGGDALIMPKGLAPVANGFMG